MASTTDLLNSIRASGNGWTLAELLTAHPAIARRTAQRLIAKLIDSGQVAATGEGRARRYFGAVAQAGSVAQAARADRFPTFIPLSADSQDILAYIDQPAAARKPVGYQRDFLDAYRPNATWYLSESLRRQLHKMGKTTDGDEPAGTYSRAILNRLLIDLSWASSHLEGNTYSLLETEAELPAPWPANWMTAERAGSVVRFVETAYEPEATEARVRAAFGAGASGAGGMAGMAGSTSSAW